MTARNGSAGGGRAKSRSYMVGWSFLARGRAVAWDEGTRSTTRTSCSALDECRPHRPIPALVGPASDHEESPLPRAASYRRHGVANGIWGDNNEALTSFCAHRA